MYHAKHRKKKEYTVPKTGVASTVPAQDVFSVRREIDLTRIAANHMARKALFAVQSELVARVI